MHHFALLVKSHRDDYDYVVRLLASIDRHNRDDVPVFIVVPDEDVDLFSRLATRCIDVLSEELLGTHLVHESTAGLSAGYFNQEIVKLAFWELGLAQNYLCVDSDAEFLRDFFVSDFMATPSTPFTFMTEDAELQCEPEYYEQTWLPRLLKLEQVRQAIGYTGPWLRTVHGHAVFSGIALQSFVSDFLQPRDWRYKDALELSPYEPTWYNTWVLHAQPIQVYPREPLFKTFHNPAQHLDYVLRGITEQDIARGFVGVVVNSNYSRGDGVVPFHLQQYEALASYVPLPTLVKAMVFRAWDIVAVKRTPWKRVRKSVGRAALRVPWLKGMVDSGN